MFKKILNKTAIKVEEFIKEVFINRTMYMGMYPMYIFIQGRLLGDHHCGLILYKGAYDKR
jgi:hypothetical protein